MSLTHSSFFFSNKHCLLSALAVGSSIDFDKLKETLAKAYASGLKDGELLYRVQKMMRGTRFFMQKFLQKN